MVTYTGLLCHVFFYQLVLVTDMQFSAAWLLLVYVMPFHLHTSDNPVVFSNITELYPQVAQNK